MTTHATAPADLAATTRRFYRRAIHLLDAAGVPFLVGGAYALAHYTGIVRHTKDFDVFIRPDDCPRAIDAFAQAGFRTEMTFAHWLGKVFHGEDFIDLIFSSGNGVARVDDEWFEHSRPARCFGAQVRLCPAEEIIWQKAYICERERFDGADVCHLIRARGGEMDWGRLLRRFGSHWRVLLMQLVQFGFVYPSERAAVPVWVMEELTGRLKAEESSDSNVCRGPLLSRIQYVTDLDEWGYADARLDGEAGMTKEQVDRWTQAGLGGG